MKPNPIKLELNEETGLWHLSLLILDKWHDIAQYCDKTDADNAARQINRFVTQYYIR